MTTINIVANACGTTRIIVVFAARRLQRNGLKITEHETVMLVMKCHRERQILVGCFNG